MKQLRRNRKYIPAALCFAMLVIQGNIVHAQEYDKLVIHAGDSISHHYSYLFPDFQNGLVQFRDGRSFTYKMNFNLVLCDMQFINKKGDTLAITNGEDIDSIGMDSCSWVFDYQKGYFQIVAAAGPWKLAVYRRTTFEPVQNGGMGESRQSGGVEMINAVSGRQGTLPLVLNQDMYVVRKTSYWLVYYKMGDMESAGKTAFMKLYGGDKKTFDQYVKANKINFNVQGDLEKLFHFCTEGKNN